MRIKAGPTFTDQGTAHTHCKCAVSIPVSLSHAAAGNEPEQPCSLKDRKRTVEFHAHKESDIGSQSMSEEIKTLRGRAIAFLRFITIINGLKK